VCFLSIIELEPYGTVTVPNSVSFHMCVFVGFDVNCVHCVHCVHDLYALKVAEEVDADMIPWVVLERLYLYYSYVESLPPEINWVSSEMLGEALGISPDLVRRI